jgi:hypothetical protein
MGVTFSTYGEMINADKILDGKPTLLGRLRHRWEDNIKLDFEKVVCCGCGLDSCGSE